jgi:hypothetical protein
MNKGSRLEPRTGPRPILILRMTTLFFLRTLLLSTRSDGMRVLLQILGTLPVGASSFPGWINARSELTLARKIATIVLIVWRGVCFDAQHLKPQQLECLGASPLHLWGFLWRWLWGSRDTLVRERLSDRTMVATFDDRSAFLVSERTGFVAKKR